MSMRKLFAMLCLVGLLGTAACADPPTPQVNAAAAGEADPAVREVLEALKTRGQDLQDFTADVTMTETDAITGSDSQYIGNVKFQRRADGDARIRVTFDRKKISEREAKYHREYKLEGGKL